MYKYLQQILFLFYQPSVEAISCVQKCKKHFKTWLRQTVTNLRLSFVFTRTRKRFKPNQPHASQICIGVIIYLSIKTQSLCDVLIGRELNDSLLRSDDWTFYDKPWGIGLVAIFWSFCGGSQSWTPPVVFRCIKEFEMRQQKKIGVN